MVSHNLTACLTRSKIDKDLYGDSNDYVQSLDDQIDEREAAIAAKLAASQRVNANLAGSSSQSIQ